MALALSTPFCDVARALRDQERVQRLRFAALEATAAQMAARGELKFDPERGLAGVRRDLVRMRAAADIMAVLARHEPAVRALDPELALPAPTMWGVEPAEAQGLAPLISRKG
jgi:hypothetical protein